ncbi:MAG: ATP-binding protein [Chloroflexota bacterium]
MNATNLPWNILGHEWAVNLLQQHVTRGYLRHAYLITGPQGIGRRTLAVRLAQAINCPQPVAPGTPCLSCRTCQQIERMQHPDLAVVQAEQVGGTLKVDQVRQLQHSLALAPYEARCRIALLLRFEEAHPSAANALLKTLEEPPGQTILLLTARDVACLLPTIVSRCELLGLRPLAYARVAQGLQECWEVAPEQAHLLAHLSGGRPGYARNLLQQPEQLEQRQTWLEMLYETLPAPRTQRFALVETLVKKEQSKEGVRQMLTAWLPFWRDVMLCTAGTRLALLNIDQEAAIRAIAGALSLEIARQTLIKIESTLNLLEKNVNTRLALEVLMLDLPRLNVPEVTP